MEMSRRAVFRDHGSNPLFGPSDAVSLEYKNKNEWGDVGPFIVVNVKAIRDDDSSYDYRITLTVDEVLRFLFALQPIAVSEAMKDVHGAPDWRIKLPEIIKHLVVGSLSPAQSTAPVEVSVPPVPRLPVPLPRATTAVAAAPRA